MSLRFSIKVLCVIGTVFILLGLRFEGWVRGSVWGLSSFHGARQEIALNSVLSGEIPFYRPWGDVMSRFYCWMAFCSTMMVLGVVIAIWSFRIYSATQNEPASRRKFCSLPISWFVPFANMVWPLIILFKIQQAQEHGKDPAQYDYEGFDLAFWGFSIVHFTLAYCISKSLWIRGKAELEYMSAGMVDTMLTLSTITCMLFPIWGIMFLRLVNYYQTSKKMP
ncbi:DUF4328 domain-containing protein [Halocynthiibacter sp.]|uniref:DUF4328 domain-containing protein n=1 Tax=Halocynthiibacter sp. TaxID=1979210 RepID=UPI003C5EB7DF